MQKKRLLTLLGSICLILVLAALPFMAACAAPTPTPVAKTLKIGCTLPLNVGFGVETKKVLEELIIPEFNKAGGLTVKGEKYNIELIIYDDKYAADTGRAAVEKLVYEDKVKHMVCQAASASIVAGLVITEQEKVLNLVGGASPKIVDPGNHYTFGTSTTRTSIPPVWFMAKKVFPNAKSVVILSPDDETGKASAANDAKTCKAMGITVIDSLFYPRATTDFAPFATKVTTLKPDLVDYAGSAPGTQLGLQFRALYEAGYKGNHIASIIPTMQEVLSVAPKEALEGVLVRMPATDIPSPSPVAKNFKEAYMNKFGTWSIDSLSWIPAWYAFVAAVKKANTLDTEILANMLSTQGLTWDCPTFEGSLVKRPDLGNTNYCDVVGTCYFGQIKDGKIVYTGTVSIDDGIAACEQALGGGKWK